ncbi:hypothetical protein M758_UG163300 [Ceratodon purpureus]|nr:hypothetical protein M758_UG163300 [Ceratodon purpureus]
MKVLKNEVKTQVEGRKFQKNSIGPLVHTNIVVITSTKVTCTFVVKMSSWNDMTLENVKADVKQLLGQSGLQF